MKRVDVVIIGAGKAGRFISDELRAKKKEVLLIGLPGSPEDYFRNTLTALWDTELIEREATPNLSLPRFSDGRTLVLNDEEIKADHFVIASGCTPRIPDEFKNLSPLLPLEALTNDISAPIHIVGGGPVGVCLAMRLRARDKNVVLHSRSERLLFKEDPDMSAAVQSWLEKSGVFVRLSSKENPPRPILATGFIPNTEGLSLDKAGVYIAPDGHVAVDEEMRTPNTRIHAAGAVTGPTMNLAYEDFQAQAVAENITVPFFMRRKLQPEATPTVIPMRISLARIGLTENEARQKSRHALAVGCGINESKIKLIAHRKSGVVLGAHIFSPGADNAVLFFDLLMRADISLHDVNDTHHFPQPGYSALLSEAIAAWHKAAGN